MENSNVIEMRTAGQLADQLMTFHDTRQGILDRIEAAETEKERAAARAELKEFTEGVGQKLWEAAVQNIEAVQVFVRKVESVAAYCREQAAAYSEQARRMEACADKACADFGGWMAGAGLKRIESPAGVVRHQNYPTVLVLDPEKVPDDLCRFTVVLPGSAWLGIRDRVSMFLERVDREPSLSAIKEALEDGRRLDGVARIDDNPRAVGLKLSKKKGKK